MTTILTGISPLLSFISIELMKVIGIYLLVIENKPINKPVTKPNEIAINKKVKLTGLWYILGITIAQIIIIILYFLS